jgi:hypothetical protein
LLTAIIHEHAPFPFRAWPGSFVRLQALSDAFCRPMRTQKIAEGSGALISRFGKFSESQKRSGEAQSSIRRKFAICPVSGYIPATESGLNSVERSFLDAEGQIDPL